LLVILSLLLWTAPAQAVTYISDDFEYASQSVLESVWSMSVACVGNTSSLGPTTEFSVSPTHSIYAVQNGGLNTCFMDRAFTGTQHFFYKLQVRFATGYDLDTPCATGGTCSGGGGGTKLIYAKSSKAHVYMFVEPFSHKIRLGVPDSSGTYSRVCNNGNPTPDTECVYEPNVSTKAIIVGTTHCVEMEVIRGSAGGSDGTLRVWIDGTKTLEYFNVPIVSSTQGTALFSDVTYYSQGGYGKRYIDDLLITDIRVPCGGSTVDTTPPATPTGLQIFQWLAAI